jgi:hypothetical protein
MNTSPRPSLHQFGLLLKAAYVAMTDAQSARNSASLILAEHDLAHVHHLITCHRASCPDCTCNDEPHELAETRAGSDLE